MGTTKYVQMATEKEHGDRQVGYPTVGKQGGVGGKGRTSAYTLKSSLSLLFLRKGLTLDQSHRAGSVTNHASSRPTPGRT
jgi:hypothetical protein